MTDPQQPGPEGSVPPENRPGHHPDVEQDQPRRPPPSAGRGRPRSAPRPARPPAGEADDADRDARPAADVADRPAAERFPFEFDPRLVPPAALFGVWPSTAYATVDRDHLTIRFGRWTLRTPLTNVRAVTPTGPYTWWKVAGPAHLSLADRGITFATTTKGGLCISFHEPVPALLPTSVLRHPAVTVTLATPDAFVDCLAARTGHEVVVGAGSSVASSRSSA